jgi:acyl-CoA synthetase (AMP-forming)/AMP-acid ligase II
MTYSTPHPAHRNAASINTNGTASPGPTLDQIFRRTAGRKPDALALADSPDRMRVTGTPPRRLTFAQADRAISAVAQALIQGGLPVGSIVGLQLPHTVDMVVALFGVLRAVDALNRIGARAFVTGGMIDGIAHGDLALNAAVEVFAIRYLGAFGTHLPEGLMPLDDVFAATAIDPPMRVTEDGRLAAMVTFDITAEGRRAVPRTHLQMTAGGLAVALESGIPHGGAVLSAVPCSSFAGLSVSLMMWLLSGEALVMHHAFDEAVFRQQLIEENCAAAVLPATVALRCADAGLFDDAPALRQVVGLWRNPEQVTGSTAWPLETSTFSDVYAFGEAGLFAARRGDDGVPQPLRSGPHGAPRASAGAPVVGESFVTPKGTLALRGPMVPVAAYAPPRAPDQALTASPALDHVDTGYAARVDKGNGVMTITAPPAGIINVGGYRFRADDLRQWAEALGAGAMLTGLPDRLSGHRLAGRAADNTRARSALAELGLMPLVTDAFRDRAGP